MGSRAWRGAPPSRAGLDTRSVIFSELCTNLVWFYEARGCNAKDQIISSLTWAHSSSWTIVKFNVSKNCNVQNATSIALHFIIHVFVLMIESREAV